MSQITSEAEGSFIRTQQNVSIDAPQLKYGLDLEAFFQGQNPYHFQASEDWMNSPTPSSVSDSPTDFNPSHHQRSYSGNTMENFSSSWLAENPLETTDLSSKELKALDDAKSRRRRQNRDSQRAFRERKHKHIKHLETALADLQRKHTKLLQSLNRPEEEVVVETSEEFGLAALSFLDAPIVYVDNFRNKG